MTFTFYEFFAGGGMAGQGLGERWRCLYANDIDKKKAASFRVNNRSSPFHLMNIHDVSAKDLPGHADLAWASFPCQDLSLAGKGAGLSGARSGAFWAFADLMKSLKRQGRAPRIIAIENVTGLITSNGHADFASVTGALAQLGYYFSTMVLDAAEFTPQSRPRLFIIAMAAPIEAPFNADFDNLHPENLRRAIKALPRKTAARLCHWPMPKPLARNTMLADIIEENTPTPWHSPAQTRRLIELMDKRNREKVSAAQRVSSVKVGAVYRRTRTDKNGAKIQRAEVRFDGMAGCLRTPGGGSSRQTLLFCRRQ